MNNDNLVIAIVLSLLVIIGFQYFYVRPQQEYYRQHAAQNPQAANPGNPAGAEAITAASVTALRDRAEVLKDTPRIMIATPALGGSVNIKGAVIDDLSLTRYRETVDPASPNITLLSPAGSQPPHSAYYAEFGWLASTPQVPMPTSDTEWKAEGGSLAPGHSVKLTWDNGAGLFFERTVEVDDTYMFTVTDRINNEAASPVTLYPYGLITRQGAAATTNSSILFEGPLGVLDGTLKEYKYAKLKEEKKEAADSTGGWLGITDKYWLVAMVPAQDEKIAADFTYSAGADAKDAGHFQADFRGAPVTIAPGGVAEHTERLFAGAKKLQTLESYEKRYDIPKFSYAIDFGWFWFLTRPFLRLLDVLGHQLGSFGFAILVFTVMLKGLTLPLSLKSYHAMSKMKALQPEMKRLQERFADDKARQSQEMMALYSREKVSPLSGCLPTIIQIPIFFALYKVLYVGLELRQAPFYGWIKDMSLPDPTSVFTLFGYLPWTLPAALHIGAWPILMGTSMLLQQKLSPQPPDPAQARMFMFMPILFTYMLAQMPAGLVIYWTWSNLLAIAQQWYIMWHDAKMKARAA